MQRAAGTFRMVPDLQTAKGESGTKEIQYQKLPALSPLESPKTWEEQNVTITHCRG